MAIHYRTCGFIIKKTDRGEANQSFTIYTKEFGKLKILGRAIRKIKSKLKSNVELFYLSDIEFIQGKTNKTLTDAILIESFQNIRKNLKKLAVVHKISENLDDLVKGQEKDKAIWELLVETFKKLNDEHSEVNTGERELIYYYFLWNLFSILGYQPGLYSCACCQKKLVPSIFYFSLDLGGVVCQQCIKKPEQFQTINQNEIKILRLLLSKAWSILPKLKISRNSYEQLKMLSDNYLSEILNKS